MFFAIINGFQTLNQSEWFALYLSVLKRTIWITRQPKTLVPLFLITLLSAWYRSDHITLDSYPMFLFQLSLAVVVSVGIALILASPCIPVVMLGTVFCDLSVTSGLFVVSIVCTIFGLIGFLNMYPVNIETSLFVEFWKLFHIYALQNAAIIYWVYSAFQAEIDQIEQQIRRWITEPESDEVTDIATRIPPTKRGDILSLQVQDKFLTVRTTAGEHTMRMTMRQALHEFDTSNGFLVNRAMWLHKDEIETLKYFNGNPQIKTVSGEWLNASRKNVGEIQAHLKNQAAKGCTKPL